MGDIKLKAWILALIAIISVLLLFSLYFYTVKRKIVLNTLLKPLFPSGTNEIYEFLSEKLSGILFTGIIPYFIFILILNVLPKTIGFTAGRTFHFWYLMLLLVLLITLISFFSSKRKSVQDISPELKLKDWYPRHLVLSASVWLCYLFGYEFLLRGVLWFLCRAAFGFWPAMIINLFLYSLVHLPKGRLIAMSAIPAGVVLCLLSELTGSFFPAFLIHSSIAVMIEEFSLYHNPELHFHLKERT